MSTPVTDACALLLAASEAAISACASEDWYDEEEAVSLCGDGHRASSVAHAEDGDPIAAADGMFIAACTPERIRIVCEAAMRYQEALLEIEGSTIQARDMAEVAYAALFPKVRP